MYMNYLDNVKFPLATHIGEYARSNKGLNIDCGVRYFFIGVPRYFQETVNNFREQARLYC